MLSVPPYPHNQTLTVGSGITPDLLVLLLTQKRPRATQLLAFIAITVEITAGGDFHPALRMATTGITSPEYNLPILDCVHQLSLFRDLWLPYFLN